MIWSGGGEHALVMDLASGGTDWIEARARGTGASPRPGWTVEAHLAGSHYKLADVFPSQEVAQGGALLLAMRLLPPHRRAALHAALDEVPRAWWWELTRDHGTGEERSIISSRPAENADEAERRGRAAGGGWWLTVFGPGGAVRDCGLVPGRGALSK